MPTDLKIIRLAIVIVDRNIWTGGYNYLLNLVVATSKYLPGKVRPVLFFDDEAHADDVERFAKIEGVEIVRSKVLRHGRRASAVRNAIIWGFDPPICDLFDANRVDVILETAQFFGWRLRQPVVAWMADFQHRVLSDLFPMAAYWKRELGFRAQILAGRQVMLSSEVSRNHCERFYPATRDRTHVVRFAVEARPKIGAQDAQRILQTYDLPSDFFFLPNQFWSHKNHECVIRALGLLKSQRREVVVAASGNPLDPRNPAHLDSLKTLSRSLNVRENFRFLGMIPTMHLHALLHNCVALINPSLFEGWSTTVEEAKSVGTPMILSDLVVHREQADSLATFFDPTRPEDLALLLRDYPILRHDERIKRIDAAHHTNVLAVKRFAQEFVGLLTRVRRNAP